MKKLAMILVVALIGGVAGGYLFNLISQPNPIEEFYTAETAVHVSPHHLRKHIADDTFVLVDLRSQEEYEREHIVGAVNIPAYKDPETSAYGDVDRIVNEFTEIKTENSDKDIIVYCYSGPCMTGRKIGKMLADDGIYVKHLGIGWNEWRYFWTMWNHEHEWNQTNVEDYVISGSEPGIPPVLEVKGCPIENEFGC